MPIEKAKIDGLKKNVPMWIDTLRNNGFNSKQISFAIPQMVVESEYYTSNSYKQDLNASGIKYRPKSPSADTTAGRKSSEYTAQRPDFYARYLNPNAYAKDYKRVLSLQRAGNKIGKPIDAINLTDFNNRLYANGYYQKDKKHYDNYILGMLSANKYLMQVFPNYLEMIEGKKKTYLIYYLVGGITLIYLIKKFKK